MPLSHSLHHTRMSTWLSNPWLCWGLGPYIASNVGFLLTAGILEVVASCMQGSLITYASSSHTPRQQLLVETHKRLPFRSVAAMLWWVAHCDSSSAGQQAVACCCAGSSCKDP